MGIRLFIGVGHETTGASTYTEAEMLNLLEWIDRNPAEHHAVLDATSMLGAMPWGEAVVRAVMAKCCLFMPFQKAIGGISGYYVASFTPYALDLIEKNQKDPAWAIPRQLKIVPPVDPKRPLTGERTIKVGPIYDPAQDKMLGGVINTYSALAFAETTFGLLRNERRIGTVSEMNRRSALNRQAINEWVEAHPLFELGVADPLRRGAAVTLLKVVDPGITDPDLHNRIIARSKQLIGYEGLTHPNGAYEPGLDTARYVNAFPGTPGDYRAWIGGVRSGEDITALLDNLRYCYLRAKIVVLEEELAKQGVAFPADAGSSARKRQDDASCAYKVLICDLVGMRFGADGKPDCSEVKAHIETKGGALHLGAQKAGEAYAKGKLHFFYQPDLSDRGGDSPADGQGPIRRRDRGGDHPAEGLHLQARRRAHRRGHRQHGLGLLGRRQWRGGRSPAHEHAELQQPRDRADGDQGAVEGRARHPGRGVARESRGPRLRYRQEPARVPDDEAGRPAPRRHRLRQYRARGRPHRQGFRHAGYDPCAPQTQGVDRVGGVHLCGNRRGCRARRRCDLTSHRSRTAQCHDRQIRQRRYHRRCRPRFDERRRDRHQLRSRRDRRCGGTRSRAGTGKVRYAAIDADIFKSAETGKITGPMVPYLEIEAKHRGKLELLPHAAADTEHVSRVEGARQAIDQIYDVIQFKSVTNLKGDLPAGYTNAGPVTVKGVGKVTTGLLAQASANPDAIAKLRRAAEEITAIWSAIGSTQDPERRQDLIDRHGPRLVKASNAYDTLMEQLGLKGPYG